MKIALENISAASDRLRPVDDAHVDFIASSIEERGLDTPFKIRPDGDGYLLVTGAHRLAALRKLGWDAVTVGEHVIVDEDMDEFSARLAEIDENLVRHELNWVDRARFMLERKKIYEQRNPVQKRGGDRKSPKVRDEINCQNLPNDFFPRFNLDTAQKIGISESTVKNLIRIGENLSPEARELLRGTPYLRRQGELLKLCDLDADDQIKVAQCLSAGDAKTVHDAKQCIGLIKPALRDIDAEHIKILVTTFAKASKGARASFGYQVGWGPLDEKGKGK